MKCVTCLDRGVIAADCGTRYCPDCIEPGPAAATFDIERVREATRRSSFHVQSVVKRAIKAGGDTQKSARLSRLQCPACFYLRNPVSGNSFAPYVCEGCGQEHQHHNTAVPRLCRECASTFGACRSCGADLELRDRKKLRRKS